MDTVQQISIVNLDDHPDNPRLVWREDVIDGIAAQLQETGFFDAAHALLVRPINGRYQIVRGHHRKQAAIKAGLGTVPCWVREMDDDEAYMQLALGNVQGELSPLEIGVWALDGVTLWQHGGGLAAKAKELGRDRSYLTQLSRAAAVFRSVKNVESTQHFFSKAQHLYAISKAPEALWPVLVELMLEHRWVVLETEQWATAANYIDQSVPKQWQALFLDPATLLAEKLSTETIGRLVNMVESILATIESYRVDHNAFRHELYEWLMTNGAQARNVRHLAEYQRNLQKRLAEAERDPALVWRGDYARWLPKQEPCDLLLTDPPYMRDVEDIALFAAEWLPKALAKVKSTGRAYVFIGAYPQELQAYLNTRIPDHMALANILVWTYRNTLGPSPKHDYILNWQAILYFRGKDAPALNCPVMTEQFAVQDIVAPDGRLGNRYHTWQKPDELAERLISHSTNTNELILDPFAGTGTFILAASRLGRRGIGCEKSQSMLDIAIERGCIVYE